MAGVHQKAIHTQNKPTATRLQVCLSTHNLQWTPVPTGLEINLVQNTKKHET